MIFAICRVNTICRFNSSRAAYCGFHIGDGSAYTNNHNQAIRKIYLTRIRVKRSGKRRDAHRRIRVITEDDVRTNKNGRS